VLARGAMTNATLRDYVIPTAADLPPIRVAFVETPSPHGANGARGLGELPMVGMGAAVANAISHAIGRPVDRLPAVPEDVLAALVATGDDVPVA
jgi:CO/xanthine dehydrogenase Mo-binding subunit